MLSKFDELLGLSSKASSRDSVARCVEKVSVLEKKIIEKRDVCLETEVSRSCLLPPESFA